jgi:hypothetical protein
MLKTFCDTPPQVFPGLMGLFPSGWAAPALGGVKILLAVPIYIMEE